MPKLDELTIVNLGTIVEHCWLLANKLEFHAGDKGPMSARLLFIALQHTHAATLLLKDGFDASASALIRANAECAGRSLYALLCADSAEINRFKADGAYPFGGYKSLVLKIRKALLEHPEFMLGDAAINNLFATTVEEYDVFCSYAHGGWQPVSWTLSDDECVMSSRFPEGMRSLGAMILAETCVQAMMVHLAVAGQTDAANNLIKLHGAMFSEEFQQKIVSAHLQWADSMSQ